jgi:hypothetical protein
MSIGRCGRAALLLFMRPRGTTTLSSAEKAIAASVGPNRVGRISLPPQIPQDWRDQGPTTTYVTLVPAYWGWYQAEPHRWYAISPTTVETQPAGSVLTKGPTTAAVTIVAAVPAAAVATGW